MKVPYKLISYESFTLSTIIYYSCTFMHLGTIPWLKAADEDRHHNYVYPFNISVLGMIVLPLTAPKSCLPFFFNYNVEFI